MTPLPRPKVPPRPAQKLTLQDEDIIEVSSVLWRIMSTSGDYVLPWNQLRSCGPLATMRWDPQHPPMSDQQQRAIMYCAADVATTVAERFAKYRVVDPNTSTPQLSGFLPTRPLRLLDLAGGWLLRNGASHALLSAHRSVCRAWSAGIVDTWPDLDGLHYLSTMTGHSCYALFPAARTAFPAHPDFATLLAQPELFAIIRICAASINYDVLSPE